MTALFAIALAGVVIGGTLSLGCCVLIALRCVAQYLRNKEWNEE